MPIRIGESSSSLQERVEEACSVDLSQCYECGKCSGGCSTTHLMDYTPRKIIQLIKLGYCDILYNSDALWLCVGCHLCVDRCPAQIDIPRIVDYLREQAYQQGIKPTREQVVTFNELMLGSVFKRGRVSEATLMLQFNLRTRRYFKDAQLGTKMFVKGKVNPFVPGVKGTRELRRLFRGKPAGKER